MPRTGSTRPEKQRALLLYMAGDNDLSDAGMRDVDELCAEGASDQLWVGVEIDTHGVHAGSIRYEITEKQEQPSGPPKAFRMVIDRLKERDSGSPETLHEFLKWGTTRFPAQEIAVVVGGHGSGFRRHNRSLAADFHGSAIDMDELSHILSLAKLTGTRRLGLLGFDACLMSLLEVADHMSPHAHVLVGSQEVEPGDGWPYDKVLSHLKSDADMHTVGCEIAASYVAHYTKQKMLNVTQSVVALDRTKDAMRALSGLGEALAAALDQDPALRVRLATLRGRIQSFRDAEYVDVIHMTELLEKAAISDVVSTSCKKLQETTRTSILCNKVPTKSKKLKDANGLSVWFPAVRFSFVVHRQKYLELSGVSKHGGWLRFLDKFFSEGIHGD